MLEYVTASLGGAAAMEMAINQHAHDSRIRAPYRGKCVLLEPDRGNNANKVDCAKPDDIRVAEKNSAPQVATT